jgi:hypothetical protein
VPSAISTLLMHELGEIVPSVFSIGTFDREMTDEWVPCNI